MIPYFYRELQTAAERLSPQTDGPEFEKLSRMADELDELLPPVLHRRFRRLCDQSNAAAAEHGEDCFRLGVQCGLLLMADAFRLGRE